MGQEVVWVLKALILPPGGLILLGLLGLFLGCRRFLGGFLVVLALAGLYLLSTPFIANQLMAGVETYPALSDDQIRDSRAEAIVVLGGGRYSDAPEYGGDTVSGLLLTRLRYAAWLSRRSGLPVIPSGGNAQDEGPAEAAMSRQVLEQEFGVRVIGTEEKSRTTWENAYLTKELLDGLGIEGVFLVTHAMHMPRAIEVMERAGVTAIPAPTRFFHKDDDKEALSDWLPSARAMQYSYYALHEYLGRLWYRVRQF